MFESKMETKLLDLPEECLSLILSLTSPCSVLRCSMVCKILYSVANTDSVWEGLLPSDLHPLIQQRSSTSPSTKHLVLLLCRSFILLENGHMSLSLDFQTGKKNYMIGARRLTFAGGNRLGHWRGKSPKPKSRFLKVAELIRVKKLRITGRISTALLSPNTTYCVYFSFMLETLTCGFAAYPVRVFVSKIDSNGACMGGESNKYNDSKTFFLEAPKKRFDMLGDVEGVDTFKRIISAPSWTKIGMGSYYNGGDSDVAMLEMTLMGTETNSCKVGLVVHAIELVPVV